MRSETYSERVERERREEAREPGPRPERYQEKLERYRREWRKEFCNEYYTTETTVDHERT